MESIVISSRAASLNNKIHMHVYGVSEDLSPRSVEAANHVHGGRIKCASGTAGT